MFLVQTKPILQVLSPEFRSFKGTTLCLKLKHKIFVVPYLYRPPGSCTTGFLENFLVFSQFQCHNCRDGHKCSF